MSRFCVFLLIVCVPGFLFAQEKAILKYASKQYNVYDGLLGGGVTYMFQDSKGYLWLRDSRFFYRFDGKTIENTGLDNRDYATTLFEHNGKIYAKRASNRIIQIKPDLQLIECENTNPLKANAFTCWGPVFANPLPVQFISWMKNEDARLIKTINLEGTTYYLTPHYALHASAQKLIIDTLHYYYKDYPISSNRIYVYGFDSASSTICRLHLSKSGIQEIPVTTEKIELPRINNLLADDQGRILFCSVRDSCLYFIDQGRTNAIGISALTRKNLIPYTKYLEDREGDHWVGCEGGLYNLFSLRFQEFRFDSKGNQEFSQSLTQDSLGQLWYNSLKTGLCRLWTDGRYKSISHPNTDKPECFGRYNFGNKLFTLYHDHIEIREGYFKQNIGIQTKYLGLVQEDWSKNRFIVDFNDGKRSGVYILKKAEGKQWTLKTIYWRNSAITSMSPDGSGNFFVSGLKGEGYLVKDSLVEDTRPRPYSRMYSSCYDRWGTLWKGTTEGLYINRNAFIKSYHFLILPFYKIIQEVRVAPRQLISNVASLIVHNDLLFACCENKLFVLDLNKYHSYRQDRFFEFNRSNGYDVEREQSNGLYVDKDQYLWILAPEKLIRVPIEHIRSAINETLKSKPFIKQILASENNLDWINLNDSTESISLPHTFKTFQISYQVNSMRFPDHMIYRYKLEGNSDRWSGSTTNKTITYSNLPHGKYRFLVEAGVDGVIWSPPAASSVITIRISWWERPSVWIASLLLLVLVIILFIWAIYKAQYRHLEQKRKLAQIQLQAIKAKSIPHFTGNALASITNLFLKKDISRATEYLGLFNQFVNQILNYADEVERPLRDELEFARQYLSLERLRFDNKINFRFDISQEVDLSVMLPSMILHTWCENAVKHGLKEKKGPGEVIVTAKKKCDTYDISVEDNGIGREAALSIRSSGNHKGLSIVEQQVTLLNKQKKQKMELLVEDLYDSSGIPSGTRFSLIIHL